jgi:hypothetical protein
MSLLATNCSQTLTNALGTVRRADEKDETATRTCHGESEIDVERNLQSQE